MDLEDHMVKSKYKPEKYLYMKVTADEYELPIAVADSVGELARMLGVYPSGILAGIKGKHKRTSYKCVRKI